MRTTVTLDDDVERMVKAEVHRSRRSFKQVLNTAIRAGLSKERKSTPKEFRVEARPLRLRDEFKNVNFNRLVDLLEAEKYLKGLGR